MVEFVVGIVVGLILFFAFGKVKKPSGTFVIDLSDPEKDVCRLELEETLGEIYVKKNIILKVKSIAELSQN